ncbi:hypothetical protein [uncultured Tenacibaculum sp.]|uniref:hypothetical protein n=1 Tax=uncultured Tenacibaculum sp. TaxID=174713 RepID=UPI002605A869|nr:hypothetical protein [uncultured Tenacibaculum sp.]
MRKIIFIVVLVISGVFTSCTDLTEDTIQEQQELEIQNTGGENDQDPDEEDEDPTQEGGKSSTEKNN